MAERTSFECPYCTSVHVDRLFLVSVNLDTCACLACGARWDEDATTGEFKGRVTSASSSVLTPPEWSRREG
jgi:transcription elongation factor Elf1